MPNLTSYHAPAIHLNRELPKTLCYLLEHEQKYLDFLCKHIGNRQLKSNIDCHNEFYKKQYPHISHFRSRQNQWKNQVESENQRLIRSMIYHSQQRQTINNEKSYKQHRKFLESMSQYSKYNLTNSICRNLIEKTKLNNRNLPNTSKKSSHKSTSCMKNILEQTMNKAIRIYSQPLPSVKSVRKRPQNLFRSFV